MLIRSIGKAIRGRATPLQLGMACVLGSVLGFVPGFWAGPGLVVALFMLVAILNANLAVFALTAGLAKLAALALMPLSFRVGVEILEGPAQPFLKKAINAPGSALLGLEHYSTTGGLAVGLAIGLVWAAFVIIVVGRFRRIMSGLEDGSERFNRFATKGWVKALSWLLIGPGKGKAKYADLINRRFGNPIRPIGVVFALLLAAFCYIALQFFGDQLVTSALRRGLEEANGATVDLRKSALDLRAGRLTVTGLALADPAKLDSDLFRAEELTADVSGRDLLRKRLTIDRVVSDSSSTGLKRAIPGRLLRPAPAPPPKAPDDKTLDDYLKDAKVWKDRLAQAKRWLDEFNRRRSPSTDPAGQPGQPQETLRQRLAREAREKGWSKVVATHLIDGSPTLLVKVIDINGLKTDPLPGQSAPASINVHVENLSTQPWLVSGQPRITVKSADNALDFDAALAGASAAGGDSRIRLDYRGLPADLIGAALNFQGNQPIKGGTIDASISGSLADTGAINLPLSVIIRDTIVSLVGAGSAPVKELSFPIGLRGRLDDPRIDFDPKAFADALAKAGANELASRARGEAEKAVGKATDKATKVLEEKVGDKLKEGLGNFLPGKDKPKDKPATPPAPAQPAPQPPPKEQPKTPAPKK
ncbi:MAG: hypothetical protein ACKVW3_13575 [Phycisphaerales bacterium]